MKKQYILIMAIFIISICGLIGCKNIDSCSQLQEAYFEISEKAEEQETFTQEELDSIVGLKSDKANDIKTYKFGVGDETLVIGLNTENGVDVIRYEKSNQIMLINNLVEDSNIGGYTEGLTSTFKVDTIEKQKEEFNNIINAK